MQPSSKWPAFRDPLLQEEFNKNGYVVVDLADPVEFKQLLNAYNQLYPLAQEGCIFSCHDSDTKRRLHAQALIRNAIEMKTSVFLNSYQFVSASFVAKSPGETGKIQPHTDHTFVDNQLYSAIAIWIPLTEQTSNAGRLHVLPGSHLYTPMCGSNLFRSYPHISISQMIELQPKVGQAVCYDLQTIHASPANLSLSPRVVANCVFTPVGAQLLHVTQRDGRVYKHAVDINFYSRMSGDKIANQTLLQEYPILDSKLSSFDQDCLAKDGSKAKHRSALQWLIDRSARFYDRLL